ncbi:9819_t:CDS:2, partial [Gigaspora margarita]
LINNRFTNKKQKKESTSEGLKKNELVDNLKATNKFIKEKEKEIDKKTFQYNNSILEAEKEELGKRIEKLKKENNKHIKDRSNTILKLIKADVSHVNPYGTFFKEVEMEEIDNIDGTKKIKISKLKYTTDNFALKPLVKWGRIGQTSNDKKSPKAPKMKLRGCFTEFSFTVIINAQSKDFGEFKIFKPPGPFIITLIFLANRAVDINEITKEVQNFCVCEPYEYKFQIYMHTAYDGSSVPKNDSGMPFCIKPSTSDWILSFGCKKEQVVMVTVDPKSLQEKIDSTIQLNENVLKDDPVDLEDVLFFGTEPNFSILYNFRLTSSAALQQLIDAIKSEVPITPPNNDSANTTEKQNNKLTI